MTKSTYDLAVLLDVIAARPASDSFAAYLTGSWSDISVAFLDPDVWNNEEKEKTKPVEGAQAQIVGAFPCDTINWIKSDGGSDTSRLERFDKPMKSSKQKQRNSSMLI